MSTVIEIEAAIERLSLEEQKQLQQWLSARAQTPVLKKLCSLAGAARGLPSDLSSNHDHYLHGTAKRSTK